ncbi:unnamed protein product [Dracunculus medinensis]|uniref:Nucleotide PPase n=1 Tax=Dracunculus medinensis TaxID=318479 RepID=A0A0N4UAG8_DRAME|nr:unnamed protein product [Dracunculus medinensis]
MASNQLKSLPINEFVEQTAMNKALNVAKQMDCDDYDFIIGCDTVVFHEGKIIGKPKDKADAEQTLLRLNNSTHEVYSGVAMINGEQECEVFHVRTLVKFCQIPAEVISRYVQSGEPMGRAGSYGIQGKGAIFIEKIDGCFYNVAGLPINEIAHRLWKREKKLPITTVQ